MDKRDQVVKNNLTVDELNLKIIEYWWHGSLDF